MVLMVFPSPARFCSSGAAEGDGNRTRLPAPHRHTRFEDEGAHQAPRPLPDGVEGTSGPTRLKTGGPTRRPDASAE